jgi:hypothetical protein
MMNFNGFEVDLSLTGYSWRPLYLKKQDNVVGIVTMLLAG